MSIADTIRDTNLTLEERLAAVADLADQYEAAAPTPATEARAGWSIGAYAADTTTAEAALDDAFNSATTADFIAGGGTEEMLDAQYEAAKVALLGDLAGDGPWALAISGAVPQDGDEGEAWSFSFSHTTPLPEPDPEPEEAPADPVV